MKDFNIVEFYELWLAHPETHMVSYGIDGGLFTLYEFENCESCDGCLYYKDNTEYDNNNCGKREELLIAYLQENHLRPELFL